MVKPHQQSYWAVCTNGVILRCQYDLTSSVNSYICLLGQQEITMLLCAYSLTGSSQKNAPFFSLLAKYRHKLQYASHRLFRQAF